MIGMGGLERFLHNSMVTSPQQDELLGNDFELMAQPNATAAVSSKTARKVAILMPNWISDFVMALSVVIRKTGDSDLDITLIVPDHLMDLCKLLTKLPKISYRRGNLLEFFDSAAMIKKNVFDKLYLLPHSFSSALFGFRTGVPVCRGISSEQRNPFLKERVSSEVINKNEHLTKEYSIVLETSYIEPSTWPGITLDTHQQHIGSVVLCPGPNNISRQWAGYKELVKLWPEKQFVILGDANDCNSAKNIGMRLPHRVENLTGKTTIEQTVEIISGASVVIATDSGLLHIAGYLGVPTVGIFGASSSLRRRPLGESVRVINSEISCAPCNNYDCPKENIPCMSSILPESVIYTAMDIMR